MSELELVIDHGSIPVMLFLKRQKLNIVMSFNVGHVKPLQTTEILTKQLVLLTLGLPGSGFRFIVEFQLMTVWCTIAQSLSLSPLHCPAMT